MTKAATVQVGLLEKTEEVAPKLTPETADRLATLLDLALDCQNRTARFQPALILNDPEPEKAAQLMDLVRAYKAEGRRIDILMDDDGITLVF